MVRVLFVCMGNICRSPISQSVFENVLRLEGLEDEVFVDSAGTGNWQVGSPPDERAQRSAGLRGLDLSATSTRSRSSSIADRARLWATVTPADTLADAVALTG